MRTPEQQSRLEGAVQLRVSGQAEVARPLLLQLAAELPDDAGVQYQAGWVHDLLGLEHEAVPFYERALTVGLPEPDREDLLLGLGSTYRNVGRVGDSLALLERACETYPKNGAMRCFLGLSRLANGEGEEAFALALDVILASSTDPSVQRYRRALGAYRDELRHSESSSA